MGLTVSHYCVSVRDLEQSCAFYGLFGFSEKQRFEKPELGIDVVYLENGARFRLELVRPRVPVLDPANKREFKDSLPYIGYQHVAFETKDIDREFQRLTDKGVEFTSPVLKGAISHYCFCWDPDGVLVELIQYFD